MTALFTHARLLASLHILLDPRPASAAPSGEQEALSHFIAGDRHCDGPATSTLRGPDAPCRDTKAAATEYHASALGYAGAAREAADDAAFRRLFGRAVHASRAMVRVGGGEAPADLCSALQRAAGARPPESVGGDDREHLARLCPATPPPAAPPPVAPPPARAVTPEIAGARAVIPTRWSPDDRARVGLGAALGATGALTLVTGAVLAAMDRSRLDSAEAMLGPGADRHAVATYFGRTHDTRSAQFGLVAAGSGLLLSLPGALLRDVQRWRPLAGLTAALGLGATVGGAIFYARERREAAAAFAVAPGPADEWHDAAFFAGHRRQQVGAAVALGAGVGLLFGSAVTLAVRGALGSRERRYVWTPQLGATGVGLRLTGSF